MKETPKLVMAAISSPLYWSAVLVCNGIGFAGAYHRGSVGWALFHGAVEVMAFVFWFGTMGR